jgi:hypothetical protein
LLFILIPGAFEEHTGKEEGFLCIAAHKIPLMIPSKCKTFSETSFKPKHVPISQITQE